MPGFYADGEYDVAGFIVGLVSRARRSSTDGRSRPATAHRAAIVRPAHERVFAGAQDRVRARLASTVDSHVAELGETVGAALLRPHRSYLVPWSPLLETGWIKGMAHITGGGITENLPRMLPDGRGFRLDRQSWTVPPLFQWLQRAGGVADAEMFRAFNMGVGLILVCRSRTDAPTASVVGDRLAPRRRPRGQSRFPQFGLGDSSTRRTPAGAFTKSIQVSDVRNGVVTSGNRALSDERSERLHHGQSWARRTRPAVRALRST